MHDVFALATQHVRQIHFIGVGGAGMSGIAEVMKNLGYAVSGSDLAANRITRYLSSLGVTVYLGHQPEQVEKADVVVTSSAIHADNVELCRARELRIPVIPRAEMLAELMRFRYGIAIAGTHGKTTTTSLIASVLAEGGLDPTFVIGGRLNSIDSHARLGSGRYLVAEADESDASFLHLHPLIAVLTNIDADHMDNYSGDFSLLKSTFLEFFNRLPFYGVACICIDDEHARAMIPELRTRVIRYGLDAEADVRAVNISHEPGCASFNLKITGASVEHIVRLNMPGVHNVQNALAAIAVAHELGVDLDATIRALGSFEGIDRRCQVLGDFEIGEVIVTCIDDYAHHPRAINAMFETIRVAWPGRRLLTLFQPHRYTRTRDLFEDFAAVLSQADSLIMTDVYAAGESPIAGADGRALSRAIRLRGQVDPIFVDTPDDIVDLLPGVVQSGDIVLLLGAGSIGRIADEIRTRFRKVDGRVHRTA